jgi:Zn-dependent alcohol dehydrogenase
MATIKAAVCREFGAPLTIENVDLRSPEPGEVEVTLDAVAICHSDITYMDGGWGGELPAIFGHEAAGVVTATAPGVDFNVGARVLVTLIRACGNCAPCATGHPVACQSEVMAGSPVSDHTGAPVVQAMASGAFAERVVVHKSQIVELPDAMPADIACLLACGVITGVGAVVNTARLRPGQDVVVIGAGGVGLNAIQGARIAGARRIVAVDLMPEKLDMALEFGATDGVLASQDKPWRAVRQALGKGADAVFVTVGAIPAYEDAPRYLAPGGKIVMVGMPHSGAEARFEPVNFAASGQGMIGSKMGDVVLSRDIPWLVDLYQQGRLRLDELISGRWTLDQINDAISDTRTGKAGRNVIML